jgi:hypothetical protein
MKIFYYGNKDNSAISDGILTDLNSSNINNIQKEIEASNGFCLLKVNHNDAQNVIQGLIKIAKDGLIFGVIIDAEKGLESYAESNYIKALSEVGISVIASNSSSLFEIVLCLKSGASIISFDKIDEEKIRNTKKIFEQYPDLIYGTYNQIQEGDEMISNQILGHGIMIDDANINLEDAIKYGVDSVILYK